MTSTVPHNPLIPPHRGDDGMTPGIIHRNTDKFRPTTCPRCHTIQLTGWTAEGLLTHLNPTPLTTTQEATELTHPHRTYQLDRNLEAHHRDASKIRHRPAGNHPTYAVLAEHTCHHPIPHQIPNWCWQPPTRPPTTTEAPF